MGQVRLEHDKSRQVKSGHAKSGQVKSVQVKSELVKAGQVKLGQVKLGHYKLRQVKAGVGQVSFWMLFEICLKASGRHQVRAIGHRW